MSEVLSSPACPRCFDVEEFGEVTVITFNAPPVWDEEVIQETGQHLQGLLGNGGPRSFVLNLSSISIQASLMVAKLLGFHKKVQAAGGRVVLCALDPDLYRVFERAQLTRFFNIFPSEEEALQTF